MVDVVFGTHNIGSLPALLERARANDAASRDPRVARGVPSTLRPSASRRTPPGCRFSVGCKTPATFCIVRRCVARRRTPAGEILSEVEALVAEGVSEITLLARTSTRTAWSSATAGLQQSCCARAVRSRGSSGPFTSPHRGVHRRRDRGDWPRRTTLMPSLHMPLQSGSDECSRRCGALPLEKLPRIIDRVRAAPDAAITTDIIVGFPGETRRTSSRPCGRRAGAVQRGFTFQYSKRPGTPAATLPDSDQSAVVKDRYSPRRRGRRVAWTRTRRRSAAAST